MFAVITQPNFNISFVCINVCFQIVRLDHTVIYTVVSHKSRPDTAKICSEQKTAELAEFTIHSRLSRIEKSLVYALISITKYPKTSRLAIK